MKYAVSELKAHLTRALREVEAGHKVEVTRHGKSVAVLIAKDDYEALTTVRPGFSLNLRAMREAAEFTPLDNGDLKDLRDRETGRKVHF